MDSLTASSSSPPEALTSAEVARILGISESWLRRSRMTTAPAIDAPPYYKVGASVRYIRRDLEAWIAAHRVDPSAEASR